jgi:hypothetical protein
MKLTAFVITCALLVCSPAAAEPTRSWAAPYLDTKMRFDVMRLTIEHQKKQKQQRDPIVILRGGSRSTAKVSPQPITVSDFKRLDPGRPAVAEVLDSMKLPAEVRTEFEKAIEQAFATVAQQLRPNNVAAAFAVTVNVAREIARGEPYSPEKTKALMSRLNDLFAARAGPGKFDNRAKQSAHDKLIAASALMTIYQQTGKANPRMKRMSQEMAETVLKNLGG